MEYHEEVIADIDPESLKGKSLLIATPMYGGQCYATYMQSMMRLGVLCNNFGVEFDTCLVVNESLISRARNMCANIFLDRKFTHLMFIDSDIGFNPMDVIYLLHLAGDNDEHHVIGGVYSKKEILWENIYQAVKSGAVEDSSMLESISGNFYYPLADPSKAIQLTVPSRVRELTTGFMMITRTCLERFKEAYPEYNYMLEPRIGQNIPIKGEVTQFFQSEIRPDQFGQPRYLSEDYWFSHRIADLGMNIWACPWISLTHTGTHDYKGAMADIIIASEVIAQKFQETKENVPEPLPLPKGSKE